jgi:hypothetical protein
VHLSRAGFALWRADGRDRTRARSGAPARLAPAPHRAVYGDKPSPSPKPERHASVTNVTVGKRDLVCLCTMPMSAAAMQHRRG